MKVPFQNPLTYDQFQDTLHTPSTTNFINGDLVFLSFQVGRFLMLIFNRRFAGNKDWESNHFKSSRKKKTSNEVIEPCTQGNVVKS